MPAWSGTGGGLPYLKEQATSLMVNQQLRQSCQVACARQLLLDEGINVLEDVLRNEIGYLEDFGTTAADTARVLSALHPRLDYAGGAVEPDDLARLFLRCPWIATLRTYHGSHHAVIVDKLEGNIVHVRDPWGLAGIGSATGTRASMTLDAFREHWRRAIHNAVVPVGRK